MKSTATIFVFSIIVAIIYGVIFSYVYPLVQIDGGLVSLFAILGVATSLLLIGAWKIIKS
jgi:hypothetical protein